MRLSGFLVALSKRGSATSFQPPQLRSARIPCNLRWNSVDAVLDAGGRVSKFAHVDHECWKNLQPGPSQREASDAINNAEINLSNAERNLSLFSGRKLINVNRIVW